LTLGLHALPEPRPGGVLFDILNAFHTETSAVRETDARTIKNRAGMTGSLKKGRTEGPPSRRTIAVVAHGIIKEDQVPTRRSTGLARG